jgi:phosphoenolpyruvate-protein kinase (PTS system EI component)
MVVGRGIPVFGGARATGPLVRVSTPDDVLRLMDDGASGVVAVVPDAGATFLAPIQEDLAGLVCLSGNTESHLAIVSRDFRTPALMAFSFTAPEPADGALVEVDTDEGTLSLAEAGPGQ